MDSAHDYVGPTAGRREPAAAPLTSWYTHGASDGLGDRLLMFDNAATGSLELLRFKPQFSSAPRFEGALRARVERLAPFRHPAFSRARSVERLEGDHGLALVSTHTVGRRLSEIFQGPLAGIGVHPAFAGWLIRELTMALADLHAQGLGIAHGALATDRIVLTPEGRLVIVDYVLGSALDELQMPAARLWDELGVLALADNQGISRLDARGDVVQIGLVALSVLLGRRITPEEYRERLDQSLSECGERVGRRAPSLVDPLRAWLTRALRHERGFTSALEAQDALTELPEAPMSALEPLDAPQRTERRYLAESRMSNTPLSSKTKQPQTSPIDPPWKAPEGVIVNSDIPASWLHDEAASSSGRMLPTQRDTGRPAPVDTTTGGFGSSSIRLVAIGLGALALVEGVVIGFLLTTRQPVASASMLPPIAQTLPVTIDSPAPGDLVMVDGQQVGVTPLDLVLNSSNHAIRVLSKSAVEPPLAPAASTKIAEARPKGSPTVFSPTVAPRQVSGGLRLSSPIELQVLEGERVLGSSTTGPIVLSAGTHQLDFLNGALGYRTKQTVTIKAGQVVPLVVQPPDGRLSINALPWAQVWIDGKAVGETPLANLPAAVGEHEIIFRHPQLGERRETAIVKSDTLTRVSATLGR